MTRKYISKRKVRQSRYIAKKKAKKHIVDINHWIEDEFRYDECVIIKNIETRKGAEENILTRSTINIQDGSICLNFNGDHFRFIGVHGNEDYFYHSVLKCFNI